MCFKKQIPIAGLALFMIAGFTLAQRGGGGRGGDGGDRGSDRGSSSTQAAPRAETTSVVHSVGTTGGGGGSSPTYGSGGYSGYSPYYYDNYWYARSFLMNLWQQYPYFSLSNYSFRMDNGDSPLDRNILRLALQDSYEAATAMVNQVSTLSGLIDQLEANQLNRKDFQQRFDTTLTEIRKLAKSIKKDSRLEYLDQRKGVPSAEPPAAASIPQMRQLVAQLSEQASAMRDGLENYYVRDYTRIVELDHLKQPSFKSISERIDKLAKAIEKSADHM